MDLMNGRVLEPESKIVIENLLHLFYTIITRKLEISLSWKNVLDIFENVGRSKKTYIKVCNGTDYRGLNTYKDH